MKTGRRIIPCLALLAMLTQAGASTLLYFEGFETNGWNGWTNDTQYTLDTNYAWAVTAPTNGPGSAHGGAKCACTYGPGTDCYLVSPPLLLPAVDQEWPAGALVGAGLLTSGEPILYGGFRVTF